MPPSWCDNPERECDNPERECDNPAFDKYNGDWLCRDCHPEYPTPPEDSRFYMTCEKRPQIADIIQNKNIPVMQNAVVYWADTTGLRPFDSYGTPYVIDSGGYSAMDRYGGEFPWTVAEYHGWLQDAYRRDTFEWAAVMDLACEPAFDDTLSVQERQDRTLENTLRHADLDPEYPVLPVLQGRTIEQWVEFHDRLADHGIDTSYVGVGTLCRQSSSSKISEIETALRTRTDVEAMHGFGVKISSFTHGAYFETADSQAWSWPTKYGDEYYTEYRGGVPNMGCREYQSSEQAHRNSLRAYYRRAKHLQKNAEPREHTAQTSLYQF